jgi:hypothetical protein
MKSLEYRLFLTLAYTAQFSYPLSAVQLFKRCVGKKQITVSEFIATLEHMIDAQRIRYSNGYFFLPGNEHHIQIRERRMLASQKKYGELKILLKFLQKIPWVIGVAITGSAAMQNAESEDDIDILLVTMNNRLWLVRPLVIFFAFLQGKRRTWSSEEENSWCFNLWLEPRTLAQPKPSHSLYVAYEVCQTDWVLNRSHTKEIFFAINSWVQHYLPQYYPKPSIISIPQQHPTVTLFSVLLTILNYIAYGVQRVYMHAHMTRERVSLGAAFFHPRDTQSMISRGMRDIVGKLT